MGRASALLEALPRPLKVAGFAVAGAAREQMRYGRGLERRIDALNEREQWSEGDWDTWRAARVRTLLREAATSVPAYRSLWSSAAQRGRDVECLADWPVLHRAQVRADSTAYVRDDAPRFARFVDQTSGSTGTPLRVVSSFEAQREWYAMYEARVRRWHGVDRTDRWAIFGGRMIAPVTAEQPPFWIWNAPMHQLYCSSYHISPARAEDYLDALRSHGVTYVVGYPSAVGALAQCALDAGLRGPSLRAVISNAEPVLDHQRRAVEACFGTPIRDTYGMAELVAGASECDHGTMHLWPDAGVVEVLDDDGLATAAGETGRVVATGLVNPVMPLIRYEIGDNALVPDAGTHCACGRTLPVAPAIEGRLDDLVVLADGRRVGRLDKIITPDLPVREVQIIQHAPSDFEIVVVAADGWSEAHATRLADALRSRIGDCHIVVGLTDSIARTKNGKLRTVISNVDPSPVPDPRTPA